MRDVRVTPRIHCKKSHCPSNCCYVLINNLPPYSSLCYCYLQANVMFFDRIHLYFSRQAVTKALRIHQATSNRPPTVWRISLASFQNT